MTSLRRKPLQSAFIQSGGASSAADGPPAPIYEQIKSYVRQCIKSGEWKPGDLISSEHELARQFGVARMTVARALRDLANAGVLTRFQGTGTFVSTPRHESTIAEIRNIDEDVIQRGRRYSAKVLSLAASEDRASLAALNLSSGRVFHSRLIHCEDDVPIQYEDRYVHPKLFPDYLKQDFTKQTPGSYIIQNAPLQHMAYQISAEIPNIPMRRRLLMEAGEPCLVLRQHAWVDERVATMVHLWHPAARFKLSGQASYR